MKWNFVNTGFNTGLFNMEFDEFLSFKQKEETELPILRVYGWNPYTISIGYNQQDNEFDFERIKNQGYGFVRRPTGGKAIFHAHELTYSVAIKHNNVSPREIYKHINRGLLSGLQKLGINACLDDSGSNLKVIYRQSESAPCFTSSAKNEIHFDGKKILGSAQRRFGNVILQHGSFLLGREHLNLIEFLVPEVQNNLGTNLHQKAIDAETILKRKISFDESVDAIKFGFENGLGINFENIEFDLFKNDFELFINNRNVNVKR